VIAFPGLVTGNLEKTVMDPSKVQIIVPPSEGEEEQAPPDFGAPGGASPGADQKPREENPGGDLGKEFLRPK